ncbi:unnamed protein product [Schistosoma margrebowiei]|uniref:Uncharacterized protein n=1 Tax=Schistosoma margrebowiei TaxID=48269 RepID=A0A183M4H9_9TREM|nr:unnamed protein product [Schistosoma margrebowiei]
MKTSTSERKHGIQWTAWIQLDNFDFADDLAFLSHSHEQMQIKTTSVAEASASAGLNIHKGTCETSESYLIEKPWKRWELTYLVSIIDRHGRFDANVKALIGKIGFII